jgi:hypothetical protein
VLTPDTMAEYGFHIECVLFDQTTKNVARPTPATAPIRVSVHFDNMKGPAIKEFESSVLDEAAFLVVRDGDAALLNVPVQIKPWVGNEGGLYVRFWTQKDLLPKAQLVLDKGGPASFIVDLSASIEAK